ncbi:hypothetical protein [Paenibacillus sp. J22TS3]|uniref:hypothetical protein n=1 Tax=Paenibacillus sp. J22TS3 TaxID=2807192 RepID=UPI001B1FB682|nr:hypothetical protein [Paenibacillus sp. J22TS3]GIP20419.1 hypothetical protein J22TS3_06940 [Paenibacillus sp. J22TS3]
MSKRITLQEMDSGTVALIKTGLFGTTINNGNAYSVTVSSDITKLEPGLPIRILVNADSTGAPTLNVNGLGAKPILKSNGNAANFKLGGLYTVAWNGSTAFILQGEGGEYGTATAADVLVGKTFGTENGVVPGSLTAYQVGNEIPIDNFVPGTAFPFPQSSFPLLNTYVSPNYDSLIIDRGRNRVAVVEYSSIAIYALDTKALVTTVSGSNGIRYAHHDLTNGYIFYDSSGNSGYPIRLNIMTGNPLPWNANPDIYLVRKVIGTGDGGCFIFRDTTWHKISSNGSVVFSNNYGGGLGMSWFSGATLDDSGNVVILATDGQYSGRNAAMIKYNSLGFYQTSIWINNTGSYYSGDTKRMAFDANGYIYMFYRLASSGANNLVKFRASDLSKVYDFGIDKTVLDFDVARDGALFLLTRDSERKVTRLSKYLGSNNSLLWTTPEYYSADNPLGWYGISIEKNTTRSSKEVEFLVNGYQPNGCSLFSQMIKLNSV